MKEPNSSILISGHRKRFSAGCVVALFFCLLFPRAELSQVSARVLFQVVDMSAVVSNQAQEQGADVRLLELGKPIEREMAVGQSHSYKFTLSANQYAHVLVEQKGINVEVTLFSPDGKP